jgi:hypothetical protein
MSSGMESSKRCLNCGGDVILLMDVILLKTRLNKKNILCGEKN